MNNLPKILVWVNCYGAWAPDLRHPIETIGYDQYLEGITNAIATIADRIEVIYASGGMVDQQGRTECATTIPELMQRMKTKSSNQFTIQADEDSLTSISIARKFLQVWSTQYPETTPLLFCDQVRYDTNAFVLEQLAKQNGLELPNIASILIPIHRLDIHPNSTPEKQAEKLKVMKEKGVDEVEKMEIEARRIK